MHHLNPRPCLLLILVLILTATGCAARLNPAEQAEVDRAKALVLSDEPKGHDVENPVLILPDSRLTITKVDGLPVTELGIPGKNAAFVEPGERTLSVMVDTGVYVSQQTSPSVGNVGMSMGYSAKVPSAEYAVAHTFEEGKHYRFTFELGFFKSDYAIVEINEADAEGQATVAEYLKEYAEQKAERARKAAEGGDAMSAYLAFSQENPDWLEGAWSEGEDENQIEFHGNTVKFTQAKPLLYPGLNVFEGTFLYNEHTLSILWDTFTSPFSTLSRKERPGAFIRDVWYYTRTGDTLEIKANGTIFPTDIDGKYLRVVE